MKQTGEVLAITALLCGLTACTSFGHDIDLSQADQLKAGVATKEDAVRRFGTPTSVSENGNGNTAYGWSYSHANGLTHSSEGKTLILVFDASGHLIRKTVTAIGGTANR